MSSQRRVATILIALLISMTSCAVLLMVLGNNPPSAGPFCLSSYYRLDPVEAVLSSQSPQSPDRWNKIEIFYSGTKAGNIEQLTSLWGLKTAERLNCHFVVCNGLGGTDGQIQGTSRWSLQWACIPGQNWYGTSQTVRICVIGSSNAANLTDAQINRVGALAEALCRKFQIRPDSVHYPSNWY